MHCANHPDVIEGVYACSRCGIPYCNDCLVTIQGRKFCARCKVEQLTDLRSGVDAALPLAGIGRRFAAVWIDGLILGIPIMIVVIGAMIPSLASGGDSAEMPPWITWASWGAIPVYIVYEALMLMSRGQTLGKMALGIKVVRPDGHPISNGQAWGRSVVRSLFVSFLALVNYIPAFFTREKTCIHDLAAKTRVVLVR